MSSETRFDVPSEVRVHVRLGTMRLDYRGALEFYERNVEALVEAAARRGARPGVNGSHASSAPASDASAASGDAATTPQVTPGAEAAAAPESHRDAYAPSSPEFGRYVRRLGPDADAPDRHVVAFALYLRNYERLETFGFDEIEGCLHAIGRTLPDDAAAVFAELTEPKRFLEVAGPNRWRLTKKGENYVKSRLLTL